MNRRDLLLQEMQIPQWVLRKPEVLKGEAKIPLNEGVKLVVVCPKNYQNTSFFHDILFALNLTNEQIRWLNMEQLMRLQINHQPIFWLIENGEQALNFAEKFANYTAWKNESWQALSQVQNKRQLWQQIQQFLSENE